MKTSILIVTPLLAAGLFTLSLGASPRQACRKQASVHYRAEALTCSQIEAGDYKRCIAEARARFKRAKLACPAE